MKHLIQTEFSFERPIRLRLSFQGIRTEIDAMPPCQPNPIDPDEHVEMIRINRKLGFADERRCRVCR